MCRERRAPRPKVGTATTRGMTALGRTWRKPVDSAMWRPPAGACIVIPVLNEEESIGGVIARIPRDAVSEIIVADGGSMRAR
jgi:hypothetical protein